MDTNLPAKEFETVLVVDDEPVVLNIICSVLEQAGFQVLRASTPHEALRIGSIHRDSIRLLVCDVVMPGQCGPMMADQFSLMHPETICLFIAGYPDTAIVEDQILGRGRAFLAKPFVPKTLVGKVREVLSGGPSLTMGAPA